MQQEANYIKGFEVLTFDRAELSKTVEGTTSFVTVGTLNVLFFQEYQRFVLWLNDVWDYALLKRIHVTSSSRTDLTSRSYSFPAYDGVYTLTLTKIAHPEAVQNFETILAHTARLSYHGEERSFVDNDASSVSSMDDVSETRTHDEEHVSKLTGASRIKRGFAKLSDKISRTFAKESKKNVNLVQVTDFARLKMVNENLLVSDEFLKTDVNN